MPTWFWIVVATVCWACWGVVQKLAVRSMSPALVQLCGAYVYSALAPLIYLAMKANGEPFPWSRAGILWTTLATALGSVAGYAFLFAIQRMDTHRVIGYTSFYPVLTFLMCFAFLGETVTWVRMAGIVLISLGTYLATL